MHLNLFHKPNFRQIIVALMEAEFSSQLATTQSMRMPKALRQKGDSLYHIVSTHYVVRSIRIALICIGTDCQF